MVADRRVVERDSLVVSAAVVLDLGVARLGEKRSRLMVAKRSPLAHLWVHWLGRVAERSLLRGVEAAEGELGDLVVGGPLAAELLAEPAVLDLEQFSDSSGHAFLGTAHAEQHQ